MGDVGTGVAPPAPRQAWRPATPAPLTPCRAPRGPQTSDPPPPMPAVPAPRTERSLRRPDKSARGPGTPPELPAPPGAPPRPAPAATPHPAGPAQALGARLGLWPGKLRSGPHAVCGHSLGSESPKPPPRTASPRRRLAPTEVGGGSGRACATAPGSGGRSDHRPGLAVGVGARAPAAVSPRPPQVHPRLFHFPAHSRPLCALTGLARPGPARQSPPRRQLLDGAVTGDTSGTTRAGQGRAASRWSREWRRRCAAE